MHTWIIHCERIKPCTLYNCVHSAASVSAIFLDLPKLHWMTFSGHACCRLFVHVSLVSRATPLNQKEGSGDSVYGELFCNKILSHPIRFNYSLIWLDVIDMWHTPIQLAAHAITRPLFPFWLRGVAGETRGMHHFSAQLSNSKKCYQSWQLITVPCSQPRIRFIWARHLGRYVVSAFNLIQTSACAVACVLCKQLCGVCFDDKSVLWFYGHTGFPDYLHWTGNHTTFSKRTV